MASCKKSIFASTAMTVCMFLGSGAQGQTPMASNPDLSSEGDNAQKLMASCPADATPASSVSRVRTTFEGKEWTVDYTFAPDHFTGSGCNADKTEKVDVKGRIINSGVQTDSIGVNMMYGASIIKFSFSPGKPESFQISDDRFRDQLLPKLEKISRAVQESAEQAVKNKHNNSYGKHAALLTPQSPSTTAINPNALSGPSEDNSQDNTDTIQVTCPPHAASGPYVSLTRNDTGTSDPKASFIHTAFLAEKWLMEYTFTQDGGFRGHGINPENNKGILELVDVKGTIIGSDVHAAQILAMTMTTYYKFSPDDFLNSVQTNDPGFQNGSLADKISKFVEITSAVETSAEQAVKAVMRECGSSTLYRKSLSQEDNTDQAVLVLQPAATKPQNRTQQNRPFFPHLS